MKRWKNILASSVLVVVGTNVLLAEVTAPSAMALEIEMSAHYACKDYATRFDRSSEPLFFLQDFGEDFELEGWEGKTGAVILRKRRLKSTIVDSGINQIWVAVDDDGNTRFSVLMQPNGTARSDGQQFYCKKIL